MSLWWTMRGQEALIQGEEGGGLKQVPRGPNVFTNMLGCEKTTHLKMLVLQTHLRPGNIEDAYSHYSLRSPKMSVINSIPDQIVNMVTMVAQQILKKYI